MFRSPASKKPTAACRNQGSGNQPLKRRLFVSTHKTAHKIYSEAAHIFCKYCEWPFESTPASQTQQPQPIHKNSRPFSLSSFLGNVFSRIWQTPLSDCNPELPEHKWHTHQIVNPTLLQLSSKQCLQPERRGFANPCRCPTKAPTRRRSP